MSWEGRCPHDQSAGWSAGRRLSGSSAVVAGCRGTADQRCTVIYEELAEGQLRGLEPLTPTLPGPGSHCDQARYAVNGGVAGVVDAAVVGTVVVRVVVRPRVARVLSTEGLTDRPAPYRTSEKLVAPSRQRVGWTTLVATAGIESATFRFSGGRDSH